MLVACFLASHVYYSNCQWIKRWVTLIYVGHKYWCARLTTVAQWTLGIQPTILRGSRVCQGSIANLFYMPYALRTTKHALRTTKHTLYTTKYSLHTTKYNLHTTSTIHWQVSVVIYQCIKQHSFSQQYKNNVYIVLWRSVKWGSYV